MRYNNNNALQENPGAVCCRRNGSCLPITRVGGRVGGGLGGGLRTRVGGGWVKAGLEGQSMLVEDHKGDGNKTKEVRNNEIMEEIKGRGREGKKEGGKRGKVSRKGKKRKE